MAHGLPEHFALHDLVGINITCSNSSNIHYILDDIKQKKIAMINEQAIQAQNQAAQVQEQATKVQEQAEEQITVIDALS